MADSTLAVVFAGKLLFGFGLPWIVVAMLTLLQRSTPRTCRAARSPPPSSRSRSRRRCRSRSAPALVALIDYRFVLLVQALTVGAAGTCAC